MSSYPPALVLNGTDPTAHPDAAAGRPLPPVRDPAGGGMPRRAFSSLLPSDPVALSPQFHGSTGQLSIIYDQSRCMSLAQRRETLLTDIRAALDATSDDVHALFTAFQVQWAAYEARTRPVEARLAALRTLITDPTTPAEDVWVRARAWLLADLDTPAPESETPDSYQAAQAALNAEAAALGERVKELVLRMHLRIISDVVVEVGVREDLTDEKGRPAGFRLVWPDTWADTPVFEPARPDTFRVLDPLVLAWIATEGVAAVVGQVRGPLSSGR